MVKQQRVRSSGVVLRSSRYTPREERANDRETESIVSGAGVRVSVSQCFRVDLVRVRVLVHSGITRSGNSSERRATVPRAGRDISCRPARPVLQHDSGLVRIRLAIRIRSMVFKRKHGGMIDLHGIAPRVLRSHATAARAARSATR